MSRFPKVIGALAAASALLVGTAACADESAGPSDGSSAATTDTLSISATGVDSLPFMAILQAGIDKGWFDEEGLTVDLYSGGGGGNTLRVVTSGDADMAIAGNTSVILAAQQPDSNLTVIAPWFQVNDFSWISPPGRTIDGATLGFSSAGSSTILASFDTRRTTVRRQGSPWPGCSFEVTTISSSARRFMAATERAWRTKGPSLSGLLG